jgi:hypothetical protein
MRISCTQLESFRLFSEQDWMTEEAMLATIRGDAADGPQLRLGRAFENVLMDPERYAVPLGYVYDAGYLQYRFDAKDMDPCLALVDPDGVFQVKGVKAYGQGVDVVAKADQIAGARIHEWKTTTGSFDVDKYLTSLQWRFEADIFQPRALTYHVFVLDDHENGVVGVRGIETFSLYPYPELEQDCREWLRKFCAYVTARGLDGVLRARQLQAA